MGVRQLTGPTSVQKTQGVTISGSSQGGSQPKKTNDLSFLSGKIKDAMNGSSSGGSTSGSKSGSSQGGSGSLSGSGSYDSSAWSGGYGGGGIDVDSLISQQRDAINSAYGNSMARLEGAWEANQNALRNNLNATLDRLKSQYDYSSGVVNDDANKSLREAYINYMMNKKNLNQGLSAMGLSGGATESSMAKMYNNYGNSRNGINDTLAKNIAGLLNEYQGNVSNAQQLYNSQYADAQNQLASQINALENAKASALVNLLTGSNLSGYASYLNAVTPSFNNGAYASQLASINNTGDYTPTTNTLAVNNVTTNAANNMGSVTDYAKWKAMADNIASQGGNAQRIVEQLLRNGANSDIIYNVLGV